MLVKSPKVAVLCNGAKVKGRASVSGCVLSTLLHAGSVDMVDLTESYSS